MDALQLSGPRSSAWAVATDALRAVDLRVDAAVATLAVSTGPGWLQEAEGLLAEVDGLFAELVADPDIDGHMAQRLEAIRDDLSGRVLAANAMVAIDMPENMIGDVLRQGVGVAKVGLARLTVA